MKRGLLQLLPFAFCLLPFDMPLAAWAAAASGTEKNLYQDSIQATKQSIAQETLDVFYHDALNYYQDRRYEEALQVLDKIYSIEPRYADVARLRATIRRKQASSQAEDTLSTVKDWVTKGDQADSSGQRVLAISYWKQALDIDPNYAPAKAKIQNVNQALAKKEFEAGYIHYHHGELEDAQESWSNAIALDPTYKQRGLLLLMAKIELQVRREQVSRLSAQGFDQFQQGRLDDALNTYQELSKLEPRHEEARRMTAKIKIQLGQAALNLARADLAKHDYPQAIEQADKAAQFGYEVSRARAIKTDAEHAMQVASRPPPKPTVKPAPVAVSTPTATAAAEPAAPVQPVDRQKAQDHYRRGLAAIRAKDYHLALEELNVAYTLDRTDEHIYVARERAQQEWSAANGAQGGTPP